MLDTFRCLPSTAVVPKELLLITTPLKPTSWADELKHMPDRQLVDYLLRGMKDGFRIGFDRRSTRLVSAKANMLSATINYEPVQAFLTKEVQASRVLGPFQAHHFPAVHVSRFGVIPKRSQPGKWRLILDLSAPSSHSVNDGIKPELCSMSYSSVDQAAKIIATLGRQARMAKIDIAHAYRNVPVHPEDRLLLGMRWQEAVYIDTVLPFGLRSAPKIFSALADTLEWILLRNQVPHIIHYLDDYFTAGAPGSDQCAQHLETITSICNKLGFPLAKDKVEGPSTVLIFLGILLDSSKMELRLPVEKLQLLKTLITTWLNRKTASKRELLSLIGHLSHATKVVPEGRTFLRRMIDLASTGHQLEHLIRLNVSFRSDLMWWNLFLDTWNRVSCLQSHFNAPPDHVLYSDASGKWGCGALCFPQWFHIQWPDSWSAHSITVKELLPIVTAVALWGRNWSQQRVLCRCDNMAVVHLLQKRSSRDKTIMHLLRSLHFFLARHDIRLTATHIPGKFNVLADALSRNHLQVFHQQAPMANQEGIAIPEPLRELLITMQPDWNSPAWESRLRSFLKTV